MKIYNKTNNVIHDKPVMEKPDPEEYIHVYDYKIDINKYYCFLSSLISKGIPCSSSCIEVWEDGKEVEHNIDFEYEQWCPRGECICDGNCSNCSGHFDLRTICVPLKQQDVSLIDKVNNYESESEADKKAKIVCFCGSTRFAEYFMIKRWELEKQGIITFGINILPNNYFADGNAHGAEQENVKDILDELHKRKIDLSDEVFILNVGGYIGESTRSELDYAIKIGKPVKYLEPITKL